MRAKERVGGEEEVIGVQGEENMRNGKRVLKLIRSKIKRRMRRK